MPSVADIERLQALLGRLVPLAEKRRGELIASDDWNVLVGALIEIGRAALAAGDDDAVPPHDHKEQVGIDWLDGQVRQLLTGGGLRDPATQAELDKLRRDISTLVGRLDRVGADLASSRSQLDTVATNDLLREASLTRLSRRVLGAGDDRVDIADLRTTLGTLQTEVARAVEVGTRLESNGQPIDIPDLAARLGEVEKLRDRLTTPAGELLDASALEVRLLALKTSLVTQDDLTQAIDDVRTGVDGSVDVDALIAGARDAGRESGTAAVETLGAGLKSQIAARLETIGATVNTAVADATGSMSNSILTAARGEIESAIATHDGTIRADIETLLADRISGSVAALEQRIGDLPQVVRNSVAREVETRVAGVLTELNGRVEQLRVEIDRIAIDGRDSRTLIEGATGRLEAIRGENLAAQTQLRADFLAKLGEIEAGIGPRVTRVVDTAREALRTDMAAGIEGARRDLETRLAEVARSAAVTETQVLSTSLRTDVQSILRQEIDAGLVEARAVIATEVAGLQQRVAGLVTNEVARTSEEISLRVDRQFETFRPEIGRIIDTRITARPIMPPGP